MSDNWSPYVDERNGRNVLTLLGRFDAAIGDVIWSEDDDEELTCGVENPEVCESCQ